MIYHLLFQAASDTLQTFGRDPKWLGGEIGITMVLHTWGQNLSQHLHVHCVVSGGALAPDGRWIPAKRGFLFPVRALSVVFRAKYLEALEGAFEAGQLDFAGETIPLAEPSAFRAFLTKLRAKDWVVYAKPPFGGPEQVLAYLGRYTHRIAIGNERLLDSENGEVRFRYRDYAHGNKTKVMRLPVEEFIRRFLLHVLPKGFMRIRHYGLLANRHRTEHLAACRAALDAPTPTPREPKPWKPSSLGCSGPMSTAARTVVKDGCARSEPSRLSLGPPAHRSCDGRPEPNGQEPGFYEVQDEPNGQEPGFYEVQDEPLRLPSPATSSDPAAVRLAPSPPLTLPHPDHTSRSAQLPDPQEETEP